jgi:hypothetical protein
MKAPFNRGAFFLLIAAEVDFYLIRLVIHFFYLPLRKF